MPDPHAIDRREALRRTAVLLGGAISVPTIAGFLAGCDVPRANAAAAPLALTVPELTLVETIAEHIIPQTDTPGAKAAGVHRFIDVMLAKYYAEKDRKAFIASLRDVDARAQRVGATSFVAAPRARQIEILTALDKEAYGPRPAAAGMHFFRTMKELTLLGYYTSEAGATKELRYVQVPGRFDGCVPYKRGSRAWAT